MLSEEQGVTCRTGRAQRQSGGVHHKGRFSGMSAFLSPASLAVGESQTRSPAAVKARLSSTTWVQVFGIAAFPQGSLWRERPPPEES